MTQYQLPVSVVHRGLPVVFCLGVPDEGGQPHVYYNILEPEVDSTSSAVPWSGYQQLTLPTERAPAGMSLLRTSMPDDTIAGLDAVSDGQYVYLFMATATAIRVSRHVMVETAASNVRARTHMVLQPAWEVRYQLSGKADLPSGERDALSARSPDGVPYIEPIYELPICATASGVSPVSLAVLLVPDTESGGLRWQLFLNAQDGSVVNCFSFARTSDGWFEVGAQQLTASGTVKPDATVALSYADSALPAQGLLAACTYAKQEPTNTQSQSGLSIKRSQRVLLAVPTTVMSNASPVSCLATVDFSLAVDGTLSGIAPGSGAQSYACGALAPAPFALWFEGTDTVELPTTGASGAIVLPQTFTLETWVLPTGGTLEPQLLIGGTGTLGAATQAPSIWIVDQLRIAAGYGDGTASHVVTTRDNVLTLDCWTHVAVVSDASGLQIFVNAVAVPLEAAATAGQPANTPVTALGGLAAVSSSGTAGDGTKLTLATPPVYSLSGGLREVRIWSKALTAADIARYLYEPIPGGDAKSFAELQAYYRADEGEGTIAGDTSQYARNGTLDGASWSADASPVHSDGDAEVYYDARGLATYAGVVIPSTEAPQFVSLAAGKRPALLDGADGLVHLYFQASDGSFCAAHYDTGIERARYAFAWRAPAPAGDTPQNGNVWFTARQSGTALNNATLSAQADTTGYLMTLTLADGLGTTETWRGVPRRADALCQVLMGDGVSSPATFAIGSNQRPFYDYSGTRRMGLQPIDADAQSALWFVASRTDDFVVTSVALTAGTDGSVAITTTSDASHPGETISIALAGVPLDADAFILTLSGENDSYDYSNPSAASATKAFVLATTSVGLVLLAPGSGNVTAALFQISAAGQPDRCQLSAAVTANGQQLNATWPDLPRDASAFVAALLASSQPDQQAIVALFRFVVTHGDSLLDGASVAGLAPALALLTSVNGGASGALTSFRCTLGLVQGATSSDAKADLRGGSRLFSAILDGAASTGFPGVVDLPGAVATARNVRPGRNGGWLYEPPRVALRVVPKGLLTADLSRPGMAALDLVSTLTVESWVKLDAPSPSQSSYYPRILHANLSQAPQPTRYMLGLRAARCLQLTQGTAVTTTDQAVQNSARLLFPSTEYTVQFYLNPDLTTVFGTNQLYLRTTDRGSESLTVGTTGLVFTITVGATVVSTDPIALIGGAWQRIVITMTRQLLTLELTYVDNTGSTVSTSVTLRNPPQVASSHSTITLANNLGSAALQAQLSTFSIWQRALTAAELGVSFNQPVDPASPSLQLLWEMDGELADSSVRNVAESTQGFYDTQFTGSLTYWAYPGLFYRSFFGVGDLAVMSRYAVTGAHQWHNLAATYRARCGIALGTGQSANCGSDGSFDLRDKLTIEAWVKPSLLQTNQRRAIISKFGDRPELRSYELGIDTSNRPYLAVRMDGLKRPSGVPAFERDNVLVFTSPAPLASNTGYYLAATISIASFADMLGDSPGQVYNSVVGQMYVNGVPMLAGPANPAPPPSSDPNQQTYRLDVIGGTGSGRYAPGTTVSISASDAASFSRWCASVQGVITTQAATTTLTMPTRDVSVSCVGTPDPISITGSTTPVTFGCASTSTGGTTAIYTGGLSDVRIWAADLGPQTIAAVYATHQPPAADDNLVSSYDFTEQLGRTAYDGKGNNNAGLSSSRMWTTFPDGAVLQLWLDAVNVAADPVAWTSLGPYGPAQFRVGGALDDNSVFRNPLVGTIDELRVWSSERTQRQLADNLYSYQAGGEAGLVGYWNFSAGSGRFAPDVTINGNNLAFENAPNAQPMWVPSTAPVASEAPMVHNVLGGLTTPDIAQLVNGPMAFEYGETQRDAKGHAFAIMKRGYGYVTASGIHLFTGYRVGDLEMIYIGQVQTKPSLIGYVEGAPPLPSENLTRPYYEDPIGSYFEYAGNASVELSQGAGSDITVTSGRNNSRGIETTATIGLSGDSKVYSGVQVPMGPVIMYQTVKFAWKAGIKASVNWSTESSSEHALLQSYSRTTSMQLTNGGDWESPSKILLHSGERRFLPSNIGCAVVKSATADMFGLFNATTGTLVSYSIVPNADIPIDTNLIYFPINPRYVSNGSLDGRVGLQADPATQGQASYFRPREAYAMQRSIEREAARLQAFYDQIDAEGRASAQNSSIDDLVKSAPLYDWERDTPRKSITNKYVWTAAGGMYKEQEEYSSQLQEQFGGNYALQWRLGAAGNLEADLGPVGLFFEAELLGGTGWTVTVNKQRSRTRSVALDVSVDGERCLRKFMGADASPPYSIAQVPGKVDTYRFMTFYIAPKSENTERFFDTVIDPDWLAHDPSPNAVALREAQAISAGQSAWRVMHRVTFVSRIPPAFQAVPVETAMPPLSPPARLDDNALFLALVAENITGDPTPAAIGGAVTKLLASGLTAILPWWPAFLQAAAVANSPEAIRLAALRVDLLQYAVDYYRTR